MKKLKRFENFVDPTDKFYEYEMPEKYKLKATQIISEFQENAKELIDEIENEFDSETADAASKYFTNLFYSMSAGRTEKSVFV